MIVDNSSNRYHNCNAVSTALGGSGAPLMQYLDFIAFRGRETTTVTLNIGGIANLQVANPDRAQMM